MPDEIIEELWKIKDGLAREGGYDVDALIARLRTGRRDGKRQVVDLGAIRRAAEPAAQGDAGDRALHSGN